MIKDFKTISEILEGGLEDTGMEPGVIGPKASSDTGAAQISFFNVPGRAVVPAAQAETSTVAVEEVPRPEQLTLF